MLNAFIILLILRKKYEILQPFLCRLPIAIEFCPETEQEVNFNMVCRVKKKTTLLVVNVKAEGFSIAALLVCEDSQGNKVNLLPAGVNLINFGEVGWFSSSFKSIHFLLLF